MQDFLTMSQHLPVQAAGEQVADRDWDTLVRARAGDREALDRLCRENWLWVYRVVSRWASTQADAEDLTQDVFVRALQSLATFSPDPAVPYQAYLLRIARNLVIDRWRTQQPDAASYQEVSTQRRRQPEHCVVEPEAIVIGQDEYERLLAAIDRLPNAYSDVLRQRIVLGQTAAEVGARTGQTANAVRQLQFRAMAALRRELASAKTGEDR